jgi:phosphatidylglycerol:prolipoprotein diacylglycerol transferase
MTKRRFRVVARNTWFDGYYRLSDFMDFWLLDFLQSLPFFLDPVALSIGSFSLRWYAICFLAGFAAAWTVFVFRTRRYDGPCTPACLSDLTLLLFLGVLLGGRLGYAFFYEPSLFLHPLSLVSPFDLETGAYTGIRGMSFFGALFGGGVTLGLFARFRGLRFLSLSDLIVPVVPIALFFGRIGNFINGELYGRVTNVPWGMNFPSAPDGGTLLRHPSQLYEAGLEGPFLFLILAFLARKSSRHGETSPKSTPAGEISASFLLGYAIIRFFVEFFREPDIGSTLLFGWMTKGQAYAMVLCIGVGIWMSFFYKRKETLA